MDSIAPVIALAWLTVLGAVASGPAGPAGLVSGAALGLCGVAFLQSLYPISPREGPAPQCDSPEALRYQVHGNGMGALPWLLAGGTTIAVAVGAGLAQALPADAVVAVVSVLGAALWAVSTQLGPGVEVAIGVHHLSIRRGWVRLGPPRLLLWDDVDCALVVPARAPDDGELVVAGEGGPLIRTGLTARKEDLGPLIAEIERQIERRRGLAERREQSAHRRELRAMERLIGAAHRTATTQASACERRAAP